MIENQIRYNNAKPRLSYFWSNARALDRLNEHFTSDGWSENHDDDSVVLASVYGHITSFLALGPGGSFEPLCEAFCELLTVCNSRLDADAPVANTDTGTIGFLNSCGAALAAFTRVCDYGEIKYSRGNYRRGAPITEYLDSALRHLQALSNGEPFDPESEQPHGVLAVWNIWQALDQPHFRDDRLPEVQDPYPPLLLSTRSEDFGVEANA